MDINIFIGTLQLILAAFQLKLDSFRRPVSIQTDNELNSFNNLGEAIRTLEYALTETVAVIGQVNQGAANQRLASLWQDASRSIRLIPDSADLADLTFEKSLYWANPELYQGRDENRIHRISLDNVLDQLRQLRSRFDKLHYKVNRSTNL